MRISPAIAFGESYREENWGSDEGRGNEEVRC